MPANETDLPARFFTFSTVGEKIFGSATRVWTHFEDLRCVYAGLLENIPIQPALTQENTSHPYGLGCPWPVLPNYRSAAPIHLP